MLIFREKEILSVAKSAFIENADFISTQNGVKIGFATEFCLRKKMFFSKKSGSTKPK